jgi:MoxR-like ATPase
MTNTDTDLPDINTLAEEMDPMDPRLDAFRPDPNVVKVYVSRMLPGDIRDTDYLLDMWKKKKNVLIKGDTQSGKTMIIEVVACLAAEYLGLSKPLPIFTLSGSSGVTDYDLFGQPAVFNGEDTEGEEVVWLPGILDLGTKVRYGIVMLDEPSMMEERVTASLHPVCDHRRTFVNRQKAVRVPGDGFMPEVRKVLDTVWIVGSYNEGYRGCAPLQEAFANRFKHLSWSYDSKVEADLLHYATVRVLAEEIRLMRQNSTVRTPVGVSVFQTFEEDMRDYGVESAMWSFLGIFTPDEKARVESHLDNISLIGKIEDEVEQTAIFS